MFQFVGNVIVCVTQWFGEARSRLLLLSGEAMNSESIANVKMLMAQYKAALGSVEEARRYAEDAR